MTSDRDCDFGVRGFVADGDAVVVDVGHEGEGWQFFEVEANAARVAAGMGQFTGGYPPTFGLLHCVELGAVVSAV